MWSRNSLRSSGRSVVSRTVTRLTIRSCRFDIITPVHEILCSAADIDSSISVAGAHGQTGMSLLASIVMGDSSRSTIHPCPAHTHSAMPPPASVLPAGSPPRPPLHCTSAISAPPWQRGCWRGAVIDDSSCGWRTWTSNGWLPPVVSPINSCAIWRPWALTGTARWCVSRNGWTSIQTPSLSCPPIRVSAPAGRLRPPPRPPMASRAGVPTRERAAP